MLYNDDVYIHTPSTSPVRLAIGLISLAILTWPIVHFLVRENIHFIAESIVFLLDLIPRSYFDPVNIISQFLFGVPLGDVITKEQKVESLIRFLLWLPSILLFTLFTWNVHYGLEQLELVERFQNNEDFASPHNGELLLKKKEEFDRWRWWASNIVRGVKDGCSGTARSVFKIGIVPIFGFYFIILFMAHIL